MANKSFADKFNNFKKLLTTKPGSENDEKIFPLPDFPEIKKFESSPFIWSKMLDDIGWRETDEAEKLWNSAKTLREKADMIFSIFFSLYRRDKEGCYWVYNEIYYSISVALAKAYFNFPWSSIIDENKTAVISAVAQLTPKSVYEVAETMELDVSNYKDYATALYLRMGWLIEALHDIHGGVAPEDVSIVERDFSQYTFTDDKDDRIYNLQATLIGIADRHIRVAIEVEKLEKEGA